MKSSTLCPAPRTSTRTKMSSRRTRRPIGSIILERRRRGRFVVLRAPLFIVQDEIGDSMPPIAEILDRFTGTVHTVRPADRVPSDWATRPPSRS